MKASIFPSENLTQKKRTRQPIMIKIDVETLNLLDHFLPNLNRKGIEHFIRLMLRKAGEEAQRRDAKHHSSDCL
jgi:hypothetical protein